MKKILVVFGTRPEAIKVAPFINYLRKQKACSVITCSTGQHREMLEQVVDFFQIPIDFKIHSMKPNQSLSELTQTLLTNVTKVLEESCPDLVVVQGDTTTALCGALAAFYQKIPVAHLEAGLRTHNIYSPWPEELNRQLITRISQFHFAPTESSKHNLLLEGIEESNISVTGNTVIDALFDAYRLIDSNQQLTSQLESEFPFLDKEKKMVLVTGHRRENFGKGFEEICKALKKLSEREDCLIVYPVHLNPNVMIPVKKELGGRDNIFLIPPQDYSHFLFLMRHAYIILTDSGGVQEEAPAIGKPVVVMRDNTERPEAVEAGTVVLSGAYAPEIIKDANFLLDDENKYREMSRAINPYGDGKACERIFNFLQRNFL